MPISITVRQASCVDSRNSGFFFFTEGIRYTVGIGAAKSTSTSTLVVVSCGGGGDALVS